jgi:probable rRNA maturation factor
MAATAAREMGSEPHRELALYLVHGLLHLCGYDDLNEAAAVSMNRRQMELLEAVSKPRYD